MKRSEFWNRLFNSGGNAGKPAKRKGISIFVGTALIAVIAITASLLTACGGATSGTSTPADSVPAAPTLAEPSVGETAVALTWDLSSPGYTNGDGTEATIETYTLFYDEAEKYDTPAAAAVDFAAYYTKASKKVIDMSEGASNVVTVDNLKAETKYYFALRTENTNGLSELSAVKEVTTADAGSGIEPAAAPGQVGTVSTVEKDGEVTVSWTAPVDPGRIAGADQTPGVVTHYTVYYTTDSIKKVSYLAGPKVKSMVFTTPDAENNSVTSGTISGLENYKTYYFAVTASNAFAEGPGYPDASAADVSAKPAPNDIAPSAPTDVTVSAGNAKALVSWKAPVDPGVYNSEIGSITGYKIYHSATETDLDDLATTNATLSTVNDGNAVSVEIDSLENGTAYFFVVVAVNGAGDGSASSKVSATPAADATYGTVPGAPTVDQATSGAASVTVSWIAPTNKGQNADGTDAELSGFTVYYSTVSSFTLAGAEGWKEVTDNAATSVTVDGLVGDTLYYFIVTASNANGESPASGSVSAIANYSDAESVSKDVAALSSALNIFQSLTEGKLTQEVATEYFQGYTGMYQTGVTWTSSGTAVNINSETGAWTITRPSGDDAADTSITLTATITKGEVSSIVTTSVTIQKEPTVNLADLTAEEFTIVLSIANPVDDGGIDKIAVDANKGAAQVATAISSGSLGLKAATSRKYGEFNWAIFTTAGEPSDKFSIDEDGKISIVDGMITAADTAFKLRAVSRGYTYVDDTYKEVDLLLKMSAVALTTDLLTIVVDNKTVTVGEADSFMATITSDLTAETDYDLSVDKAGTAVDAVTIANDGTITITNAIATTDAGTYTVTATGKGSYEGTITDDFDLTVQVAHTVTYDLNQGDGTAPDPVKVVDGETIASAPTEPIKAGHTFDGWYTATTGGTAFVFGTTGTTVTQDMTLYAQWTATVNQYTVTYNLNSGDGTAPDAETVNDGETIANAPTKPTKAGHTFDGWYTETTGGIAFVFGATGTGTPVTQDMTLHAQWTAEWNVANVGYTAPDPNPEFTAGTENANLATLSFSGTVLTIGTDFEVALVDGPDGAALNNHVTLSTSGVIGVTMDIAAADAGAYTFKVVGLNDYSSESEITDATFTFTLASN